MNINRTGLYKRRLKDLSSLNRMKIGLFGGSFNPAHKGHFELAKMALKRLNLDQIWWLVSSGNPLKTETGNYRKRLNSVEEIIVEHPDMFVSFLEQDLKTCYTIDLLEQLKQRFPSIYFVWIIGADNLNHIHLWKQWKNLFLCYPIAVFARPMQSIKARLGIASQSYQFCRYSEQTAHSLIYQSAPCWCYITCPLKNISSTQIRENIISTSVL